MTDPAIRIDTDSETADLCLVSAERTLETEIAGLSAVRAALKNGLSTPFKKTFELIQSSRGRVIVTGVGKSGHIGTKIAASLASTGTPAHFVHATEASHGDMGMITQDDVVIAISWSGETQELAAIVAYTRRFKVPLVSITSREDSTLGRASDIVINLPAVAEACPHGLAPTTSALVQLAIGDALAVALLEGRGFSPQDYKVLHPGGRLGASLKSAKDIMHTGDALPLVKSTMPMSEGIVLMSKKSFGVLGVIDELNQLIGIITDGDLRRHISSDLLAKTAGEIMTRDPKTVSPAALSASVLELVNSLSITSVFVVEDARPVGIVHLHDLLRIGAA
ncbi:KpsF/GutQ family sugar-phosphate isomerase [Roseibium denhamense]|uniref:Arabinose-5-phosphate isomerase n=1 Tax=Roseibium denhamense TaxID=76305 RepID=A0ABY1NKA6_9HYPH|nr:KpsF/GutQ family sugar-phosphate isomerase [Roseibium denhamense]MTI06847.1 KpsF/GutQ family sugar-phosphate isomerase [Roseibium denhamense]SMP11973.1 arabinose-5-phosphate isomerase [Roseibium denhamense]